MATPRGSTIERRKGPAFVAPNPPAPGSKTSTKTVSEADICRRLVRSLGNDVKGIAAKVPEIVKRRAWEVLGYENFPEMFEAENGFMPPTYLDVLVVEALAAEGMRGPGVKNGDKRASGHREADIARMAGLPIYHEPGRRKDSSPMVGAIRRQLSAGVRPERVIKGSAPGVRRNIEQHGARARSKPRRMGKSPDELVSVGLNLPRRDADAIAEIARSWDLPNTEIYRQAVAEYLARHRTAKTEDVDKSVRSTG